MARKLKEIGIILVAVFALTAVAAQVASADTFRSTANNTTVTGKQGGVHVFTITRTEVKCQTAKLMGEQIGKAVEELTVHPEYADCRLGTVVVTVNTTGCNYVLDGETEEEDMAPVDVECEAGKEIKIEMPGCTISIPAQVELDGLEYSNTPGSVPPMIDARATVSGITATVAGALCGLFELTTGLHSVANGNAATYSGTMTVSGEKPPAGGELFGYSVTNP